MGIETLSMVLAANESREVDVSGEYFELRAAVYEVAFVELLDRSGGVRAKVSQPLESDYVRPGLFEKVRITNGATAQTVKFVYGTGDAGSRRNSGNVTVQGTVGVSGTVSVVDGGKARTLANQVFGYRAFIGAAGAGIYNYGQIWNPAASGKRLVVKSLMCSGAGATVMIGNAVIGAANGTVKSKLSGGAAPSAESYLAQTAGAVAGATSQVDSIPNGVPNVQQEPIVIKPGYGLIIGGDVANVPVTLTAHFIEEPDV
jgi:hypothetical protein